MSGLQLNADKTEVFNLCPSPYTNSRVRYIGKEFSLGRLDKIKVCGMILANDQATEYELNVLARIETMESMSVGWGRRHLSINGRMMVAKSFILSQKVFPAQFTSICNKEIKKIERLVYSYVNGARNLYGPERIARRYLKASKINGGINGIDVNSFLTAIALRQFGKAMSMSRALKSLQSSLITIKDDIGSLALRISKAFCRDNPMPDLTSLSSSPVHGSTLCSNMIRPRLELQINMALLLSSTFRTVEREVEFLGIESTSLLSLFQLP